MPILQNWNDLDDHSANPAVGKKTMVGAGGSLVRVAIERGFRADRHSHDFDQFVQVLTGSGSLETAEGIQRFSAGCVFHFTPGTWHAAQFDEDTVLVETNLRAN